jgi:Cu+-exporting ATPase
LAKIKCDHCHLEFDESVMIKDDSYEESKYFCCKGCQGVYALLNSNGLDSFYDKLGSNSLTPPKNDFEDLYRFDLEGFYKRYVKTNKDGFCEINLVIEGIHCSACVWLNEKVLHQSEGIVEAVINYSTNKAKIVWDDGIIKLSKIIEIIRSIGYDAYAYDPLSQEIKADKNRRDYYARLLLAIFATMNIMWIAIAQYTGYFTGMRDDIKEILNIAEFFLATPTLFYTGWVFYKGAYFGLKNRFINMDVLVSIGATLTYLYSIYALITKSGEVYFDSVTMIITFVFVGKYLEILSKKNSVDVLDKLTSSLPTEVIVIKDGKRIDTLVEDVKIGDIIELKAGNKVVIDGVIVEGGGSFDESSITGEAEPVYKKVDDDIKSGSILLDATINYKATCSFESSLLNKIVTLLEDSLNKRPKIELIANEISGYFSLAILLISLLTFIGWYYLTGDFERSLIISISVIVIACPCALGLATPVSTMVGLNVAAKKGILFKEALVMESIAKCDVVCLDKTGTITEGSPKVISADIKNKDTISLIYSLVSSSNHPISQGIKTYLLEKYQNLQQLALLQQKSIVAKGISAKYEDKNIYGGNERLLEELGIDIIEPNKEGSKFYFVVENRIEAVFVLKDKPKDDSKRAIEGLKSLGLEVIMLTGDNKYTAKEIADEVGIDNIKDSLSPLQKAEFVESLVKDGKKVIMAGDGINDTLCLTKSNIAVAMGNSADIALEVSDVVLLNDNLTNLLNSIKIGKRVYKSIKQNLTLSLIYNSFTIPLAVAGYVIPFIAALSMSLSSIVVVANAMRIKGVKL